MFCNVQYSCITRGCSWPNVWCIDPDKYWFIIFFSYSLFLVAYLLQEVCLEERKWWVFAFSALPHSPSPYHPCIHEWILYILLNIENFSLCFRLPSLDITCTWLVSRNMSCRSHAAQGGGGQLSCGWADWRALHSLHLWLASGRGLSVICGWSLWLSPNYPNACSRVSFFLLSLLRYSDSQCNVLMWLPCWIWRDFSFPENMRKIVNMPPSHVRTIQHVPLCVRRLVAVGNLTWHASFSIVILLCCNAGNCIVLLDSYCGLS